MNRLEIAVSLLGGGNFALSDTTIREAFKNADRIIAIHEKDLRKHEDLKYRFDKKLAETLNIMSGESK